jgi:hypothetical protein
MQIGDTVKFELFLGRYVDGVIRSVWNDRGLLKLRVEYGPGSFATILPDEIMTYRKRSEIRPPNKPETDSDTYF